MLIQPNDFIKFFFLNVFYPAEHTLPDGGKLILQWGSFISKYAKKHRNSV